MVIEGGSFRGGAGAHGHAAGRTRPPRADLHLVGGPGGGPGGTFSPCTATGSGPPRRRDRARLALARRGRGTPREALDAIDKPETVATLSCSVPPGSAAATLRHGAGGPAWTLAAVRETGHLKDVAADAGLRLKRTRPARPPPRLGPPWTRASTSCTRRSAPPSWPPTTSSSSRSWTAFSAAEIAAAAPAPPRPARAVRSTRRRASPPAVGAAHAQAPESWVRLFVSAGQARRHRAGRPARRAHHNPVGRSRKEGGAHRRARKPLPGRGARKRREKGDLGAERA